MARLSELRPVSLDITVSSDTYNYLEYVSTQTELPFGMIIDRLVHETRTNRPETAVRRTLEQALTNFTLLDNNEIRESLQLLQIAFENVLSKPGEESRMRLHREAMAFAKSENKFK